VSESSSPLSTTMGPSSFLRLVDAEEPYQVTYYPYDVKRGYVLVAFEDVTELGATVEAVSILRERMSEKWRFHFDRWWATQ
jgi:hypothetical protein